MNALLPFALGLLGLLVGSFLTVVVARLGTGETILLGRSHCPHCARNLRWYELLPVLSYLAQGGQCRSCGYVIPRRYLGIELSTAFLFAGIGWGVMAGAILPPAFIEAGAWGASDSAAQFGYFEIASLVGTFLYYAFFASIGVAISAYDLAHRLIPGMLVWPLAFIGFSDKAAGAFGAGNLWPILLPATVSLGAFAFFWLLWRLSAGRAMGRGDADVALVIGAYLPPMLAVSGILFSFWIGALYGIVMMTAGRLGWRSTIPFAPFLFMGALAALFLSNALPRWMPF